MTVVGYVQYNPRFADKPHNLRAIDRLLSAVHADLLVLPELAATGYDFINREQARSLAETFGEGPTFSLLRMIATRDRKTIVAGYPELDGTRVYNSSVLVTPDGKYHNYRKIHLFSREKELFDPGDAIPPVIDTPAGKVGMMICFDWFFPEVARILALNGAQIIAHPSNLVLPWCQRAMFARCVENHLFAVTANRIGEESTTGRTLRYTGASQIMDFSGNLLCSAPTDSEHVGTSEIDPASADNKQITPYNNLMEDRRIDLFAQAGLLDQSPADHP